MQVYPPILYVGRASGLLIGLGLAALSVAGWWHQRTPLERFYLRPYLAVSAREQLPRMGRKSESPATYLLLTNQTLLPGQPKGVAPLCFDNSVLTTEDTLRDHPAWPVTACAIHWPPRVFRQELMTAIYGEKTAAKVVSLPAEIAGGLLLLPFVIGAVYDTRRNRRLTLEGVQTKGPKLMTQWQYNRKMLFGKNGLRIITIPKLKKADF